MFLSKNRQKLHHFHYLTERQRSLKPNLNAFLQSYWWEQIWAKIRNEFIVPIGLMVDWVVSDSHGSLGTDQSKKSQCLVLQILWHYLSLRKTVGKVSPILVMHTSRSDSNFERSNISFKETEPDGVDWNSNGLDYCVRNNEGKIRWFSADWSGERRLG